MSALPIDFVASGGRELGLGHVVRSARLAREAARRGWSVRGLVDGDAVAHRVWLETSGFEARPFDPASDRFAPLVSLDAPYDKGTLLEHLAGLGVRPILIDDERPYAITSASPRGWRVLPGLHHGRCETSGATDAQGFALLSGPRYAILSDAHRAHATSPSDERHSLLVTLGGSDPHRAGPVVGLAARDAVRALARAGSGLRALQVDVVFGPSFEDPADRDASILEAAGCRVHRGLDAFGMADRMRSALLAIVGFGTSVTELAWHATPFLTIPHHDHDRGAARDLASRGFGRALAAARRLNPTAISVHIVDALRDETWRTTSAARARDALGDGEGVTRIFARIETELALRAPWPRLRHHEATTPPG
ncbi:MAG: hypothetical protein NXI30_03805 [bacterium]|nr:hypothetical protein [bacterium]